MSELLESYRQLTDHAAAVDMSWRTRLRLVGADVKTFLHNLCTNDINRLTEGTGCEAFVTNVRGRCWGFIHVFCRDKELLIDTVTDVPNFLLDHMDRYVITEDVSLADHTNETCSLLFAGPQIDNMLAPLMATGSPADLEQSYQHISSAVADADCLVARVPWLNVPAYLMIADADQRDAILTAVEQANVPLVPDSAWNIARIESRYPLYGVDITGGNLPQEVDRNEQAISFTKGCYLGQETVARLDALGHVNKQLVCIQSDEQIVPEMGSAIQNDGKQVGEITSAAWNPSSKSVVAMGYVRVAFAKPGTKVQLATGSARVV